MPLYLLLKTCFPSASNLATNASGCDLAVSTPPPKSMSPRSAPEIIAAPVLSAARPKSSCVYIVLPNRALQMCAPVHCAAVPLQSSSRGVAQSSGDGSTWLSQGPNAVPSALHVRTPALQ